MDEPFEDVAQIMNWDVEFVEDMAKSAFEDDD